MPSSTLSERIAELVADRNLPRGWQAQAARHCRVKPASVADWVSGKTKTLKGDTLLLAAEFFGCNPHWLQAGRGSKYGASDVAVAERPALYVVPPAAPAQARSGGRADYRVIVHSLLAALEQTGQTITAREFVDRADAIYRDLSK